MFHQLFMFSISLILFKSLWYTYVLPHSQVDENKNIHTTDAGTVFRCVSPRKLPQKINSTSLQLIEFVLHSIVYFHSHRDRARMISDWKWTSSAHISSYCLWAESVAFMCLCCDWFWLYFKHPNLIMIVFLSLTSHTALPLTIRFHSKYSLNQPFISINVKKKTTKKQREKLALSIRYGQRYHAQCVRCVCFDCLKC